MRCFAGKKEDIFTPLECILVYILGKKRENVNKCASDITYKV